MAIVIPMLLFAVLCIHLKTRAPGAKTYAQVRSSLWFFVIDRVSLRLRAHGVLMVKILNKCILGISVCDLVYRQIYSAILYIHRNISIHRYIGCRHEIEFKFYFIWRKFRNVSAIHDCAALHDYMNMLRKISIIYV